MKIGFVRFPKSLYQSGKKILGGSEIANQYFIDFFRSKNIVVEEFTPIDDKRINLHTIPAIGTLLMFQGLKDQLEQINKCDVLFSSHWFGVVIPEITIPQITLFHHNADLVFNTYHSLPKGEEDIFNKWLSKLNNSDLGLTSDQAMFDKIISFGEKYLINNSKLSVSVSNYLKGTLIKSYGVLPDKVAVIYNSYPSDWSKEIINKDFQAEQLNIISVSRLPIDHDGVILKGIDRLLDVFDNLKDQKYDKSFLGSTNSKNYGSFFAKQLPSVKFLENANREVVKNNLSQSHVSIHCSRCESFGLTLTESMLMGNIAITFPTGVAEEIIVDGENGFLVQSVGEMLDKIKYLNENREILPQISKNARQTVLTKMAPDVIGNQYLELINRIKA